MEDAMIDFWWIRSGRDQFKKQTAALAALASLTTKEEFDSRARVDQKAL
jgi:hypothetical protein